MHGIRMHIALLGLACPLSFVQSAPSLQSVRPDDSRIVYEGRVLHRDGQVLMDWPCITIRVHVAVVGAGSVVAQLDGGGSRFLVTSIGLNDSQVINKTIFTSSGMANYTIAEYLEGAAGQYAIAIRKVTEAKYDTATPTFEGFQFSPSVTLAAGAPQRPTRRVEFFGDSNTAGFGIHGEPGAVGNLRCFADGMKYENCNDGYAALLARALDAEMHLQAWSGKGVVTNSFPRGGKRAMPTYWKQTLATDTTTETKWDFAPWVPDVVIVYLGSNDFMSLVHTTLADFIPAYTKMLSSIFASYANATKTPIIVNICGGGKDSQDSDSKACDFVRNASSTFQQMHSPKAKLVHFLEIPLGIVGPQDWGCIAHRNSDGQRNIANFLEPSLRRIMGWDSELIQ